MTTMIATECQPTATVPPLDDMSTSTASSSAATNDRRNRTRRRPASRSPPPSPFEVLTSSSLAAMMARQASLPPSISASADPAFAERRRLLVDWMYSVVDECGFSRETVAIAARIVDAVAHITPNFCGDGEMYHLLCMTGIYVAIKFNEGTSVGSSTIASLSNGLFGRADVEAMERAAMRALEWRVAFPTPVQIASHMLALAFRGAGDAVSPSGRAAVLDEMAFRTENAARDYILSTSRPATVAVASVLGAAELLGSSERRALLDSLAGVLAADDVRRYVDGQEDVIKARTRLNTVIYGGKAKSGASSVTVRAPCLPPSGSLVVGAPDPVDVLDESTGSRSIGRLVSP
mmetsp:Transcript_32777/g.78264  ORF Transcript_32777/g.78264 Transcript_32777/m.78264 type:complete len:348 (-) Transcript_32777:136-1179(-)